MQNPARVVPEPATTRTTPHPQHTESSRTVKITSIGVVLAALTAILGFIFTLHGKKYNDAWFQDETELGIHFLYFGLSTFIPLNMLLHAAIQREREDRIERIRIAILENLTGHMQENNLYVHQTNPTTDRPFFLGNTYIQPLENTAPNSFTTDGDIPEEPDANNDSLPTQIRF